jgi:hypothetical protein
VASESPPGRRKDWTPPKLVAEPRFARGDDIEVALETAERLFAMATDDRRHVQRVQLAAYGLALTVLSVAGVIVAVAGSAILALVAMGAAAAVGLVFAPAGIALLVRSDRGLARLRTEIAHDLATFVSESYLDIADREGWTEARIRVTRLRLSTFPLQYADASTEPLARDNTRSRT